MHRFPTSRRTNARPLRIRPSQREGGFCQRPGRINSLWLLLSGAVALVIVLSVMLMYGGGEAETADSLTIYAAAGLRYPVEEIAAEYEKEYGTKINIQLGGSNTLLNQISVNKFDTADLYLAADDFYTDQAVKKGFAVETMPIAHQGPVIAVPKGNPKGITSIYDLLNDDIAVAMANPDQAAVGRAARDALKKIPHGDGTFWDLLEKHVTDKGVFKPTVNDVASDVMIAQQIDAGIVWDSTVAMPKFADDLEAIAVEELATDPNLISIAVLRSSTRPTAAIGFARYLTARDKGLPIFKKYGTRPVDGDVWAERPEVTFFCGAVNRKVVEKVVAEFEAREGVTVNTVFDGCGILTGRMKTIADQNTAAGFPDIYMACDVYYLENVKPWFQDAVNVSDTEIVMAVPKGSDKVKTLEDLIKPGVRVAIGEPNQCTIGALTRNLLQHEELYAKLMEKQKQEGEVVVEKPSSALLVPDVVTGHVDVTLAYVTDVNPNLDKVDIIKIQSPLKLAIQPVSIARSSDHKYLMGRLHKRITQARDAIESAGFHYRLDRADNAFSEQGE